MASFLLVPEREAQDNNQIRGREKLSTTPLEAFSHPHQMILARPLGQMTTTLNGFSNTDVLSEDPGGHSSEAGSTGQKDDSAITATIHETLL